MAIPPQICQFLFIFRRHSRARWRRSRPVNISTYLLFFFFIRFLFLNTEVWWWGGWQWFNPCLGYLRQCSHTQTHTMSAHSWTLLHLTFYSDLSRRSCARVSRTCCFRLPEQMDIRSAFYFPSQTNDLPSPFSQPYFRFDLFCYL